MNIKVSGKNLDLGASFRQHAETSIAEVVNKYFERAISASVILTSEGGNFMVRVNVVLTRRMDMEARGMAGDPRLALDEAITHIETRLRRYKRRLRNHHVEDARMASAGAAAMAVLSPAVEADDAETADTAVTAGNGGAGGADGARPVGEGDNTAPVILAEMDYVIHELTLEEAVMQFDLSGQTALMFRNKSHLGLNMLYRRADGSIGWVDPRGNR